MICLHFLLIPSIFGRFQSDDNHYTNSHQNFDINSRNRQLSDEENNKWTGDFSSPLDIPILNLNAFITQSLFHDCINRISHGGAIHFSTTSESRPNFELTSSTFINCESQYYGSRGGAVYVKGFQVTSKSNCFVQCLASTGTYCYFDLADGSQCLVESSTFHSSTTPGIGEGAVFIRSLFGTLRDCNFTRNNLGGNGAGFFSEISVSLSFVRNHFERSSGPSIVYFNVIPDTILFQYSNFIYNSPRTSGLISVIGNHAFDNCYFFRNDRLIINLRSGTLLLFRCTFDMWLKDYFDESYFSQIFHGKVSVQEVQFSLNTSDEYRILHNSTNLCPCSPNSIVLNPYTPTKTPMSMGYTYNTADILTYIAFIVIFISLVFLLISFLWLCFWSKPQLKQAMKYLRVRHVNTYNRPPVIENQSDSITDDESDSHALFDANEQFETQFHAGTLYNNDYMTLHTQNQYKQMEINAANDDNEGGNDKKADKKKKKKDKEAEDKSVSTNGVQQYHFPIDDN